MIADLNTVLTITQIADKYRLSLRYLLNSRLNKQPNLHTEPSPNNLKMHNHLNICM